MPREFLIAPIKSIHSDSFLFLVISSVKFLIPYAQNKHYHNKGCCENIRVSKILCNNVLLTFLVIIMKGLIVGN